MGEYQVYHCTARGYSHVLKGTVCQDASSSLVEDDVQIAVIADGHGDPNCFRSDIGSQIACKVSVKALKQFADALKSENQEEEMLLNRHSERLVSQLFSSILHKWNVILSRHARENPPTEEELAKVSESVAALYRSGKSLLHMYGCTLIAMLKTQRYLLLLQQGDGHCTIFYPDGSSDQPIPWDPRCEGRSTTSLCDEDVTSSWRYHIIDIQKKPVIACYACSDGVEDSYETEDARAAYLAMLAATYVVEGRDSFLETLEPHLSGLSENGSMDDISVACILDPAAIEPHVSRFTLQYDCIAQETKLRRAQERLASMERKTQYLTQQLAEKKDALEREGRNLQSTCDIVKRFIAELREAKNSHSAAGERLEAAKMELEKVQQEYDEYMKVRQSVVEVERAAQEQLSQLRIKISQLPPAPIPAVIEGDDTPVYRDTGGVSADRSFDEPEQKNEDTKNSSTEPAGEPNMQSELEAPVSDQQDEKTQSTENPPASTEQGSAEVDSAQEKDDQEDEEMQPHQGEDIHAEEDEEEMKQETGDDVK